MTTSMGCRVVFRIDGEEILIPGICHRKEVYPMMEKRHGE